MRRMHNDPEPAAPEGEHGTPASDPATPAADVELADRVAASECLSSEYRQLPSACVVVVETGQRCISLVCVERRAYYWRTRLFCRIAAASTEGE